MDAFAAASAQTDAALRGHCLDGGNVAAVGEPRFRHTTNLTLPRARCVRVSDLCAAVSDLRVRFSDRCISDRDRCI